MKLPHTEVKFYPKVKSQTGLSSIRVSCKHALTWTFYSLKHFLVFTKFAYKYLAVLLLTEAVTQRCSVNEVFLEILQNLC